MLGYLLDTRYDVKIRPILKMKTETCVKKMHILAILGQLSMFPASSIAEISRRDREIGFFRSGTVAIRRLSGWGELGRYESTAESWNAGPYVAVKNDTLKRVKTCILALVMT